MDNNNEESWVAMNDFEDINETGTNPNEINEVEEKTPINHQKKPKHAYVQVSAFTATS